MLRFVAGAIVAAATLLPGEVALAGVPSGTYKGRTQQNGPISIVIKHGSVTSVTAGVVGGCLLGPSAQEQWIHTFKKSVRIKHGRIEFHVSQKSNYAIDLSARIKGRKITGTVDEANPDGCLSPKLKFTASR